MGEGTKEFKVKVGAVLHNRNALEQMLGDKIDKLIATMDKVIKKHLEDVGTLFMRKARNMLLTYGSGRKYIYVDEEGTTINVENASEAGEPPAVFTGELFKAIDYKIEWDENTVRVGIFTDALERYATIMYNRNTETVTVDTTGTGGGIRTPIKKYAEYLEEGTKFMEARPFLDPSFREALIEARKIFRKEWKAEVLKTMRRKKLAIYFRFYDRRG